MKKVLSQLAILLVLTVLIVPIMSAPVSATGEWPVTVEIRHGHMVLVIHFQNLYITLKAGGGYGIRQARMILITFLFTRHRTVKQIGLMRM